MSAGTARRWSFAAPPGGTGPILSVVLAPLVFATAIAARTSRLRVGTAVLVLPLGQPGVMAEEVATVDNISQGRFDLGIGRSGFPRSYEGYDLTYEDVVRERVVFGTPERVAERLQHLQETLGLSGFIMEANIGGRIPPESVL